MANSLGNLMNYGLSNDYWNEFIFQSYVNHKPDVTYMQVSRLGQFCIVYRTYTIRQWQLSLKLTNFLTEPFKVHSNTLKIAVIQTVIKNEVKAVDNQLIDEALSLYNDLRLHAYKVLTHSDDRERVDKLVPRAFYRYERRKLLKNRHKFNPLRTPTRAMD